jgi:Fe-S-cluster-containing dehydrogenase component/DMSO reductase anchor subunit
MHVCPTTATRQRADGIVTIDYDLCIGCAYCEVACPYQARFLIHEPHFAYDAAIQNEIERLDSARFGVAQKCTFCSDRVDFGIENGLTPGLDPRATPACVNSCIADALHFGDADDPNSNVSQLLRQQRSFRMHAELGTDPGFHYLYGKASDPEKESAPAVPEVVPGASRLRTRGVEPSQQQHWDWKAAGNFICGGTGSGLFVFTALASLEYGEVVSLGWAALGLVALGLFLVLLKIGRPLRSIYVLRQPQRSWMAREAWIATIFFPLAGFALVSRVPTLLVLSAAIAVLFLCSQAMILKEARGIPAWRTSWTVPLMVVTGLAEGSGLFLAVTAQFFALHPLVTLSAAITIVWAALRALVWRIYQGALESEGAPTATLKVLRGFGLQFFAIGLALPSVLVVAGVVATVVPAILFAIAGVCIAAAGAFLKFILVTRAGFNQGFALVQTPVRGAGIAGPAVKPGWSRL